MDHRVDQAGDGEERQGRDGTRGRQHEGEDCNDEDVNIAAIDLITVALNTTINIDN